MIIGFTTLALLLALGGCADPEAIGHQLCIQQCEAEGRDFQAIERCRAACRGRDRPDGG